MLPVDKTNVGFLKGNTAAFYKELFCGQDLLQAIDSDVSRGIKTFHSEATLLMPW